MYFGCWYRSCRGVELYVYVYVYVLETDINLNNKEIPKSTHLRRQDFSSCFYDFLPVYHEYTKYYVR